MPRQFACARHVNGGPRRVRTPRHPNFACLHIERRRGSKQLAQSQSSYLVRSIADIFILRFRSAHPRRSCGVSVIGLTLPASSTRTVAFFYVPNRNSRCLGSVIFCGAHKCPAFTRPVIYFARDVSKHAFEIGDFTYGRPEVFTVHRIAEGRVRELASGQASAILSVLRPILTSLRTSKSSIADHALNLPRAEGGSRTQRAKRVDRCHGKTVWVANVVPVPFRRSRARRSGSADHPSLASPVLCRGVRTRCPCS